MSGGSDPDGANPEGAREVDGEPVHDEFDAIVALWRAEGRVPQWPAETGDPGPGAARTLDAEATAVIDPVDTVTSPQPLVNPARIDPVTGPIARTSPDPVTGPIASPVTGPVPVDPPRSGAGRRSDHKSAHDSDHDSDHGADHGADDSADHGADQDTDHYVPPEPPPLPRVGPPAIVGGALLALGLLLVIAPSWLGMSEVYGLPLGLISLAAGLGWLVLRLWPDAPSAQDRDDDGDDGAIV